MDEFAKLVALTLPQFAAVVALFLPGFVALKVDRLIQPSTPNTATEFLVDTLAYSLLNAAALGWAIWLASDELNSTEPHYVLIWALGVLVCIVGPVCWPVMLRTLQRFGAKRRWFLGPHRFAWDNFFSRNEPCWIIVHLKGGLLVGGYFGPASYATVEPQSGHIYLEELWRLDNKGAFIEPVPASKGALFRPSDYDWVEVFHDGPA